MVKKSVVDFTTVKEIDAKVEELKEQLAKEKGMLVSKTKSVNSAKKKELRKFIAKLLTKRNQITSQEIIDLLSQNKKSKNSKKNTNNASKVKKSKDVKKSKTSTKKPKTKTKTKTKKPKKIKNK